MSGMNKKKPQMTRVENDLMMNRLSVAFVVAISAVTAVMSVRNANDEISMIQKAGPVLGISFLALAVVFGVIFAVMKAKKVDDRQKIVTKTNVLGIGVISLVCGLAYLIKAGMATGYAVVLILGAMVLYGIWFIYAKDFFALSAFSLAEGMLLHISFHHYASSGIGLVIRLIGAAACIALPVAFFVGALLCKKKGRSVNLLFTAIPAAVAFFGSVLLLLDSLIYVPCSYVIIVLVAVYLGIGIIQSVRMI